MKGYLVYSHTHGVHIVRTTLKALIAGLVISFFIFVGFSLKNVYAATTHTVCASGCSYSDLQDAINNSVNGDTVELNGDLSIGSEIYIDKAISLDGNGYTISPTFTKTTNDNNAAIGIIGTSNVIIFNLQIEGTGGTTLHGINIYESTAVHLNNVSSLNNDRSGIVVNSSAVTVTDINTGGNGWHGINVDSTGLTTSLTVNGTSVHSESTLIPDIFVDNTTEDITVNDTNSQYSFTNFGVARAYKLNPDTEAPQVTFTYPSAGQVVGDTRVAGTIVDDTNITQYSFEVKGPNGISWNTKKWSPNTASVNFDHNLCEDDRLKQCDEDDLPSGIYKVNRTLAYDGEGNDSRTQPGISFVIDKDGPSVSITDPAADSLINNVLVDGTIEDQKLSFFNIELSKIGDPNWNFTTQKQHASPGQTLYGLTNFNLLEAAYYGTCNGVACAGWQGGVKLPDGAYKIRVNAYDEFGNRTIYSHQFTLDTTPPAAPTLQSPGNGVPVNGTTPVANDWDVVTGADHYIYQSYNVDSNGDCILSPARFSATYIDSQTNTRTLPDGLKFCWQVRAVDAAGNESSWSPLWLTIVDNTAPVVAINSWSAAGNVITPDVTATDPGAPLTYVWSANDANSASNVDISAPDAPAPDFTVNADGTYGFTLVVTDAAGNESLPSTFGFTYTTPPVQEEQTNSNNNNTGTTTNTPTTTTSFVAGGQGGDGGDTAGGFSNVATTAGDGAAPQVLAATTTTPDETTTTNDDNNDFNSGNVKAASTEGEENKGGFNWWILAIIAAVTGLLYGLYRRFTTEDNQQV